MYNHAAAAQPSAHSAPLGIKPVAQPSLMPQSEISGDARTSAADLAPRTPPVLGRSVTDALFSPDVQEADGLTGTGPHPALRKPGDSQMMRTLNQPPVMNQVEAAFSELSRSGRKVTQRELVTLVAERAHLDEQSARTAVRRWRETRNSGRS